MVKKREAEIPVIESSGNVFADPFGGTGGRRERDRCICTRAERWAAENRANNQSEFLAGLAVRLRLPAIYSDRRFPAAGGLMSYGIDNGDLFRRAAPYIDRILRGEKPGDLPGQQPTKFELVINLKTAKALGLTIPAIMQATADEVIE